MGRERFENTVRVSSRSFFNVCESTDNESIFVKVSEVSEVSEVSDHFLGLVFL